MDVFKSILGIGPRLRKQMLASDDFSTLTTRVFPVVSKVDEKLPFVSFFRVGTEETQVKDYRGPRKATYQIQIFSEDWESGVNVAEAACNALHGYHDDVIREVLFTDASENFDATIPAYVQILTFLVRI
jgi:hypothetical protein